MGNKFGEMLQGPVCFWREEPKKALGWWKTRVGWFKKKQDCLSTSSFSEEDYSSYKIFCAHSDVLLIPILTIPLWDRITAHFWANGRKEPTYLEKRNFLSGKNSCMYSQESCTNTFKKNFSVMGKVPTKHREKKWRNLRNTRTTSTPPKSVCVQQSWPNHPTQQSLANLQDLFSCTPACSSCFCRGLSRFHSCARGAPLSHSPHHCRQQCDRPVTRRTLRPTGLNRTSLLTNSTLRKQCSVLILELLVKSIGMPGRCNRRNHRVVIVKLFTALNDSSSNHDPLSKLLQSMLSHGEKFIFLSCFTPLSSAFPLNRSALCSRAPLCIIPKTTEELTTTARTRLCKSAE